GYQYCDLLLTRGDHAAVRDRASRTLGWVRSYGDLLAIALDTLAIGRAQLGVALTIVGAQKPAGPARHACSARVRLDATVDGLRAAGRADHLPRGLLARADLRRSVGDWEGAALDLDEVEEIAEPGPMRLFLCDMALERARLAFAKIEAFAPLS